MKKSIIIIAAILIAGFSTKVMAQVGAITLSHAKGEIITPISISEYQVMDFGKMAVQLGQGGTCELTTAAAHVNSTGGVAISLSTPKNGIFDVTGENNTTYAITIDPSITVTKASGSETMIIDVLKLKTTSNVAERLALNATSTLSATGTDQITLGGTLNVGVGQAKGIYSGTFNTIVIYN